MAETYRTINSVKCKKCRKVLFIADEYKLVNCHGEFLDKSICENLLKKNSSIQLICETLEENSCIFLNEEPYPPFILDALNEGLWQKGKLYCFHCKARLGSFNFVNIVHCSCNMSILPPVHLLTNKIDFILPQDMVTPLISHPLVMDTKQSSVEISRDTEACNLSIETLEGAEYNSDDELPETVESVFRENILPSLELNEFKDFKKKKSNSKNLFKHPQDDYSEITLRKRGKKDYLESSLVQSDEDDEINQSSCLQTNESELKINEDRLKEEIPDALICPICLDLLFSPFCTKPCGHIFCEPCLRRLAKPAPTNTSCPLCRELIGVCNPCPEILKEIKENFSKQYEDRFSFEKSHNSQHLPLPWLRDYRFFGLRGRWHGGGGIYGPHWSGWRLALWIFVLDCLGLTLVLAIKWVVGDYTFDEGDIDQQNKQKILVSPNSIELESSYSNDVLDIDNETFLDSIIQ